MRSDSKASGWSSTVSASSETCSAIANTSVSWYRSSGRLTISLGSWLSTTRSRTVMPVSRIHSVRSLNCTMLDNSSRAVIFSNFITTTRSARLSRSTDDRKAMRNSWVRNSWVISTIGSSALLRYPTRRVRSASPRRRAPRRRARSWRSRSGSSVPVTSQRRGWSKYTGKGATLPDDGLKI